MASKSVHPFVEQLAQILDREPAYYQLLISVEPTLRMNELVESLTLEGDPDQPETTLTLFEDLNRDPDQPHVDKWLARLRDAARQLYQTRPIESVARATDKLLHLIYAEPRLYELVASVEPGYGLTEILESLALEVDGDDVEAMFGLMQHLAQGTEA